MNASIRLATAYGHHRLVIKYGRNTKMTTTGSKREMEALTRSYERILAEAGYRVTATPKF